MGSLNQNDLLAQSLIQQSTAGFLKKVAPKLGLKAEDFTPRPLGQVEKQIQDVREALTRPEQLEGIVDNFFEGDVPTFIPDEMKSHYQHVHAQQKQEAKRQLQALIAAKDKSDQEVKDAVKKFMKDSIGNQTKLETMDVEGVLFTQEVINKNVHLPSLPGESNTSTLEEAADMIKKNPATYKDFGYIRVFEKDGEVHSLDNRRLYLYRTAGVSKVKVIRATEEEVERETSIGKKTASSHDLPRVQGKHSKDPAQEENPSHA